MAAWRPVRATARSSGDCVSTAAGAFWPFASWTSAGVLSAQPAVGGVRRLTDRMTIVDGGGSNVLAFSASIDWDIQRIQARGAAMTGGLYNVTLRGTGYVAVTTKGEPVALDVASAPTFMSNSPSPVCWQSGTRKA